MTACSDASPIIGKAALGANDDARTVRLASETKGKAKKQKSLAGRTHINDSRSPIVPNPQTCGKPFEIISSPFPLFLSLYIFRIIN